MEQKIKIVRKSGFTHIPNPPLRDQALTLQSKGLFCMMLSLPEGWDFTVGGLAAVCGCGRDKIRACLRNLEAAGYLLREQGHGSDGQFAGNVYVLYDEKCAPLPGFPSTGKPSTENPLTENPTQYKKDIIQERENTPPYPPRGAARKACAQGRAGVEAGALRRVLGVLPQQREAEQAGRYPGMGQAQAQRRSDQRDRAGAGEAEGVGGVAQGRGYSLRGHVPEPGALA